MTKCPNVVELLNAKFGDSDSVATRDALYLTHVSSVAPYGYLNIVFNPLPPELVELKTREMNCPAPFARFLRYYNGLRLFFTMFCVYGLVDDNAPIERRELFAFKPFSLSEALREVKHLPGWSKDLYPVGWYGFNGSHAFLRQRDMTLACYPPSDLSCELCVYPSFEEWLEADIQRISTLYSPDGKLQVPAEMTIPGVAESGDWSD